MTCKETKNEPPWTAPSILRRLCPTLKVKRRWLSFFITQRGSAAIHKSPEKPWTFDPVLSLRSWITPHLLAHF